ncbi:hypothetical protein NUW54_g10237 [Trametes sanguinea]|uniref:Uncharacterized protein n=1 Tax=Trametes sanguinea TaxID=158606 RepID=A0ACC1P0Z8_9APHY|nr:hypothetical protein NUW54_g10237 [Trametes sanguinea]
MTVTPLYHSKNVSRPGDNVVEPNKPFFLCPCTLSRCQASRCRRSRECIRREWVTVDAGVAMAVVRGSAVKRTKIPSAGRSRVTPNAADLRSVKPSSFQGRSRRLGTGRSSATDENEMPPRRLSLPGNWLTKLASLLRIPEKLIQLHFVGRQRGPGNQMPGGLASISVSSLFPAWFKNVYQHTDDIHICVEVPPTTSDFTPNPDRMGKHTLPGASRFNKSTVTSTAPPAGCGPIIQYSPICSSVPKVNRSGRNRCWHNQSSLSLGSQSDQRDQGAAYLSYCLRSKRKRSLRLIGATTPGDLSLSSIAVLLATAMVSASELLPW